MTARNYRVRFAENNMISSSNLIEYSSQQAAYPFTNCLLNARQKLWKFGGCFVITDANNKIYINDGADVTITLTNGKYSTGSALATHIQTQLNALSTNWTVTYDSSTAYRFRVQRTSPGTLRLSQTTDAVWDTIGFTTALDLSGTSIYADSQRNHTEEYAIFDLGLRYPLTFVSLLGQIGTSFLLSNSATITIQASNVNLWDSPPLSQVISSTDKGAMRFIDDITDTNYRYWKIKIVDRTNPLGGNNIGISNLYIGDYQTILNRNINVGFNYSLNDRSKVVESESGVMYSDVKSKFMSIGSLNLGVLDQSDKDAMLAMFERLGITQSFFISLDPTNIITADLFELTKLVKFAESPSFQHIIRDIFTMQLSVREVI